MLTGIPTYVMVVFVAAVFLTLLLFAQLEKNKIFGFMPIAWLNKPVFSQNATSQNKNPK